MFLQLIVIVFILFLSSISGECIFLSLPKIEHCRAKIKCSTTLSDNSGDVSSWECIKHENPDYRYRYNYGYVNIEKYIYDTNYELDIELQNVDINISEDPLNGLNDKFSGNIKSLNVVEGNMVSVPRKIYLLNGLKELVIVQNVIEKVDLIQFSSLSSLTLLNISHNAISMLDNFNYQEEGSSNVHTIDMSHNELDSLPDNCFSSFSRLTYLDLSYNLINTINILTFEGIKKIETLLLSNNKLEDMGLNFVRFINLKVLKLDHNLLTSLSKENLKSLTNLENLDMSSNQLKTIKENSFSTLQKLQILNLSYNQILVINAGLFKNNVNLQKLCLSHNYIESIQDGVFEGKYITHFSISGNSIGGTINYKTFLGIHVDILNLSGERITALADNAFSNLGSELTCLNLSGNSIELISKSCFSNLTVLEKLDLSNNNLVEVDIENTDLRVLKEIYLQQNNIKKISNRVFNNLGSLMILDLSQNSLEKFDKKIFEGLINLETLRLSSNELHSLELNVFSFLKNLKKLDMCRTKIISLQNSLFSGLISLKIFNASRGQLEIIEYEAFNRTGKIEILDVSYNMLENFTVNTNSFSQLKRLYLNHNKLIYIAEFTFLNMNSLQKLDLSYNNILYFNSRALRTLVNLNYFNLSFNPDLQFDGDVFNNLHLSDVILANIRHPFNFSQAHNVSIATLILSGCNISDIDSLFVYNIEDVSKLILQSNMITSLSKESFKKMKLLNSLDLSKNNISYLQPGTFLFTDMINTLYLNENNLQTLQFGSLDGLRNLRLLNLSRNAIREFNPKLLRGSPHLSKIYLENNDIVNIDFKLFAETSVTTLFIGQNPLACDQLTILNSTMYGKLKVTVDNLDFNTENIDGIPCITYSIPRKDKIIKTHENTTTELTELRIIVSTLKYIFSKNLNETSSVTGILKDMLSELSKYENEITAAFNESKVSLTRYLQETLNKQDLLRTALINSNMNVTEAMGKVLLEFNNNFSNWSTLYYKENKEAMKVYHHNYEQALASHQHIGQSNENKSKDSTYLIYILTIFLTIQSILTIIFIFYTCIIKNRKTIPVDSDVHDSNHPLNVIEME